VYIVFANKVANCGFAVWEFLVSGDEGLGKVVSVEMWSCQRPKWPIAMGGFGAAGPCVADFCAGLREQ
jgi:hypothetical protein